ncbi:unnamed protein product, partial [marine sediment metagenome]
EDIVGVEVYQITFDQPENRYGVMVKFYGGAGMDAGSVTGLELARERAEEIKVAVDKVKSNVS